MKIQSLCLGYCALFTGLLAVSAFSSISYTIKKDQTALFRTEKLEPPPLASLSSGEVLTLIYRGQNTSQIKTDGGLKGWIQNENILATKDGSSQSYKIQNQNIIGQGETAISPLTLGIEDAVSEVSSITRSFDRDLKQLVDREQLEMTHDEN